MKNNVSFMLDAVTLSEPRDDDDLEKQEIATR